MCTPNIECTIACLLRPVVFDRLLLLRNFANQAPAMNVLEAFQGNGSFDSNKHPQKFLSLRPSRNLQQVHPIWEKGGQNIDQRFGWLPSSGTLTMIQNARQMWSKFELRIEGMKLYGFWWFYMEVRNSFIFVSFCFCYFLRCVLYYFAYRFCDKFHSKWRL